MLSRWFFICNKSTCSQMYVGLNWENTDIFSNGHVDYGDEQEWQFEMNYQLLLCNQDCTQKKLLYGAFTVARDCFLALKKMCMMLQVRFLNCWTCFWGQAGQQQTDSSVRQQYACLAHKLVVHFMNQWFMQTPSSNAHKIIIFMLGTCSTF